VAVVVEAEPVDADRGQVEQRLAPSGEHLAQERSCRVEVVVRCDVQDHVTPIVGEGGVSGRPTRGAHVVLAGVDPYVLGVRQELRPAPGCGRHGGQHVGQQPGEPVDAPVVRRPQRLVPGRNSVANGSLNSVYAGSHG
jgi:hypothetical protein